MKHLVIGASGQVGGALFACAHEQGMDVYGTCLTSHRRNLRKLDITERSRVLRLVRELSPDVIYATAAMSSADRCEGEPELSYQVSVRGIENLIDAANRADAILVHISSDYIFDGKDGPYYETEPASPINVYGLHKVLAEHLIATKATRYLIVRTTVVYGWEDIGKNFVMHLKSKLIQGQAIKVPNDQIGTPTYNRNLARAIIEAVEKWETNGVINIVGPSLVSRYEFALQVANVFGLDPRLIKPTST
ncbi:MAG: SDR family oxidoreductase, partial [Cyanobacteria bacterium]|nr:SDR family oxidoreductase [Cyanobacteriota bacterium]